MESLSSFLFLCRGFVVVVVEGRVNLSILRTAIAQSSYTHAHTHTHKM